MTKTSPDDPRFQPDKFRDLARQLGCDEDEKAFEEKVKRVAGTPPAAVATKPK
jgi:hypothetical protein